MCLDVVDAVPLIRMWFELQSHHLRSASEDPKGYPRSSRKADRHVFRIWAVAATPRHIMKKATVRYSVTDNAVAASGIKRREQDHASRSLLYSCVHHVLPSGLLI